MAKGTEKKAKQVVRIIVKCHTAELLIALGCGFFMGSYCELKKANKEAKKNETVATA